MIADIKGCFVSNNADFLFVLYLVCADFEKKKIIIIIKRKEGRKEKKRKREKEKEKNFRTFLTRAITVEDLLHWPTYSTKYLVPRWL